jgi:hypothetical protein
VALVGCCAVIGWPPGRCLSYGGGIPYLPIVDVVRANCGIVDRDSAPVVAEKVRLGLQEVASLAEILAGAPIMLLCTWRPGCAPPWTEHSYSS